VLWRIVPGSCILRNGVVSTQSHENTIELGKHTPNKERWVMQDGDDIVTEPKTIPVVDTQTPKGGQIMENHAI